MSLQTMNNAVKLQLYLFGKFGGLDFNKRSTNGFQVTALVVKGYTTRTWEDKGQRAL